MTVPYHDPDPGEEVEFDIDVTVIDKQVTHSIDDLLGHARQERYPAADKEWMEPVVESVRDMLLGQPYSAAILDAARRRVWRREAEASKKTNRLLRDINQTGQMPLGWGDGDTWHDTLFDMLHLPLAIGGERVRFGVATANDLVQWELESAREQDKRNAAQAASRDGARLLSAWMQAQKVRRIEELRPNPPKDEKTP